VPKSPIETASLPTVRAALLAFALASPCGAAPKPSEVTLDLGGGVRLELVLVKAGAFTQGSAPGEADRGSDEGPREVRITRDYYIGRYEVTVGQWSRFAADFRYRSEAEKGTSGGFGWDGRGLVQAPRYNWRTPGHATSDRHPVTIVTYDDALAFARWATSRTGWTVTLPTEAQWEYAARAGTTSRFYGGSRDAAAAAIGWFRGNAPDGPHEVGQKTPNAFGLYDTAGNAYEWCLDWYAPLGTEPVSDPVETRSDRSDKPRRVLRGGSWLKDAKALRSAARYRNTPGSRNADNGFRVVAYPGRPAAPAEAPAGAAGAASSGGGGRSAGGGGNDTTYAVIGFGVMLAVGAPCVGLSILAARYLLRRRSGVRTRISPDGFTLRVPGAVVGQRLDYRYRVGGVERRGAVTVTGDPDDGVFVYTGDRPSAVEYLAAAAAADVAERPLRAVAPARPSAFDRRPEPDEPFRGYPSAY
jgi:formylglycine-generating enzyme required for sulfatase activity